MRTLSLRRSGALLLLALLSAGCTESLVGPGGGAGEMPREEGADGSRAYRRPAALVGKALAVGHEATLQARSRGLGAAEVRAEGERAVQSYLAGQGIGVRLTGRPAVGVRLSPVQARYLDLIQQAVEDLGPGVRVRDLEMRLAGIERQARRELDGRERETVLLAIAAVTEFWREMAMDPARVGLVSADGVLLDLYLGDGFSWGGLAGAVTRGIFVGTLGGIAGGFVFLGGPGIVTGAITGGVAGGVSYGMDYLWDVVIYN